MVILASQIIHLPILLIDEIAQVGTIKHLIFDPKNGSVMAFGVATPGLLSHEKYLTPADLVEVQPGQLSIRDENQLVDLSDIVRLKDILRGNTPIVGQKAKTKSGKSLGKVSDVLIELSTWTISKYYLHKILDQRILDARFVEEITHKAVIFSDKVSEPGGDISISEIAETQ